MTASPWAQLTSSTQQQGQRETSGHGKKPTKSLVPSSFRRPSARKLVFQYLTFQSLFSHACLKAWTPLTLVSCTSALVLRGRKLPIQLKTIVTEQHQQSIVHIWMMAKSYCDHRVFLIVKQCHGTTQRKQHRMQQAALSQKAQLVQVLSCHES